MAIRHGCKKTEDKFGQIYYGQDDFHTKQKIASAKKNPPLHGKVAVPYVNILTLIARRMSRWNPRYELIKLRVKYDLASVSKMGYHKVNRVWIKKNQPAEAS